MGLESFGAAMSDLIFDTDSSGAERDFNELTSAVKELRAALMLLNNTSVNQLEKNLAQVATATTTAFAAVEGRLSALEKNLVAKATTAGKRTGKAISDGLASSAAEVTSTTAGLVKLIEAEVEISSRKMVAQATAASRSAYSLLRSGSTAFDTPGKLRAKSAGKYSLDDFRNLVGMPDRGQMKSFAAQLKAQMQEDVQLGTLRARAAGKFSVDDFRNLLGMPDRGQMKTFASQLKAQMQEEVQLGSLKAKSAGRFSVDDFRSLVGMPERGQMKSFAAQLKAQMLEDVQLGKLRAKSAAKYTLEDYRALMGLPGQEEMRGFSAQLKARMRAEAAALAQSARSMVAQATANPSGPFMSLRDRSFNPGPSRVAAQAPSEWASAAGGAVPPTNRLTSSMNDLHSAARGVASGFGAMWLTWGNLGPLLAGAALSNGFVQAVQKGSQFMQTLTAIEALAGESAEGVASVGEAALEMGRSGPFGPLLVADAFKTLALAGLSAKEQLEAISAVRNLSLIHI